MPNVASDPAVPSLRPEPAAGRPRTPAREPAGTFDVLIDSRPQPRSACASRRERTPASDRHGAARGTEESPRLGERRRETEAPDRDVAAAANPAKHPDAPAAQAKKAESAATSQPVDDARPNVEGAANEAEQFAALAAAVMVEAGTKDKAEATPVAAADIVPAEPEKPQDGEATEVVAAIDPVIGTDAAIAALPVPPVDAVTPADEPTADPAAAPAKLQAPQVPGGSAPELLAPPAAAPADAAPARDARDTLAKPQPKADTPAAPDATAADELPAPALKAAPVETAEPKGPVEKADHPDTQQPGEQRAPARARAIAGPPASAAQVAPERPEVPVPQPLPSAERAAPAATATHAATREAPAEPAAPATQPAGSAPSHPVANNAPIIPLTPAGHAILPTLSPLTALRVDPAVERVPVAGLAVEIVARAHDGLKRFDIRLDPPELGRIDVRLDVDHSGKVTSRLVVERVETLDLLRRDAPQLERALQHAGLNTEGGLQFSLRDQNFANRDPGARDGASVANLVIAEDEPAAAEAARRGYGRLIGLGGGVDIRV